MRIRILLTLIVGLGAVLIAVVASIAGRTPPSQSLARVAGKSACPTVLKYGLDGPEQVLATARRLIPVAFKRKFRNQSGYVLMNRRNYTITTLLSLDPAYGPYQMTLRNKYRSIASRFCGAKAAQRSWVVIFQVPKAGSADYGDGAALIARTSHGWRIWEALAASSIDGLPPR